MAILTPAEARGRVSTLPASLSDAEIVLLVAEFAEIAERYRGVVYEPTAQVDTFARPVARVQLSRWPVRSITSFTVDAVPGNLAAVVVTSTGIIVNGLWANSTTLVVTFSHGLDNPPPSIKRACAEYVRATAMADRSGTSRDVIAQSFDGGITRYSTPDWEKGRPTGWLEIDRLLNTATDHRIPGMA